jgi:hypothetical protein
VVPNPGELLVSPDLASALNQLRYVASATDGYHDDLLNLLSGADAIDAAHLSLILDSVYYTRASVNELRTALKHPETIPGDDDRAVQALAVKKQLTLALSFAPMIDRLLATGMSHVTGLDFDSAVALLRKSVPGSGATEEFQHAATQALALLPPLNDEQHLTLSSVYVEYGLNSQAIAEVMSWFRGNGLKSVSDLVDAISGDPAPVREEVYRQVLATLNPVSASDLALLVSRLSGDRGELILASAGRVSTALSAEVAKLIALANGHELDVLNAFFPKVSDLTHQNVALMAAKLPRDIRDDYVIAYLNRVPSLLTDEMVALASLVSQSSRDELVLRLLPKVTDRQGTNIAKLFGLLSRDGRALSILRFIDQLDHLTTDVLIALSDVSPERKNFILLTYLDRLSDFTVANAIRISKLVYGDADRDSVLLLVLQRSDTVSAEDLVAIARASTLRGERLIFDNMDKIPNLQVADVVALAAPLSYGSKDRVIRQALPRLTQFTTSELISLARAAYSIGAEIATKYLDRLTDFSVANVKNILGLLSYSDRNTVIFRYLSVTAKVSTVDLMNLAYWSYGKDSEILIGNVEKVSDLTVENARKINQRLSYSEKDTFLLKAVDLVTDLSSANLLQMANDAYAHKDEIIQKGINRLARPSGS